MSFFKTTFYSSISTAVTFISGFIVAKVVAVKIGPSGIAMVGQFQNTIAIFTVLGSGAINVGVVKYLAEYIDDKHKQQQIISHAISIVLCCSFSLSLFVLLSSGWLAEISFHSQEFWIVFFLFGLFLTLITVNTIFTSVFNGLQEIKKLTISNILLAVSGIIFTTTFAYTLGAKGVLIGINASALVTFLINYSLFKKLTHFHLKGVFKNWDKTLLKKLFTFSLMSGVSAFVIPISQLMIRNRIVAEYNLENAGYWQGVTKISDYYLTFITTVLSVYYLPKLSQLKTNTELREEIFKGYKMIVPAVAMLSFAIWFFRSTIIYILFSKDFLPMQELFLFQLIGDVIKISSWLLAFLMLAKSMVKVFIVTEIFFAFLYVGLSYLFIARNGIIGVTQAFALNYLFYFITMIFVMKRYLKSQYI